MALAMAARGQALPLCRLMLTISTSGWLAMMSSSAAIQSDMRPVPVLVKILYTASLASGAMPSGAAWPSLVMMPATLVPWPKLSSAGWGASGHASSFRKQTS